MNLKLVGLSHKTAPLEVRERLHVPESRLIEALREFAGEPGVEECFILSTCNRVELLVQLDDEVDGDRPVVDFLSRYHGVSFDSVGEHLYELEDLDAVTHLFRVTCSLDSMVVGEPQIVGQVRDAVNAGRKAGTLGGVLNAVLDKALAVAGRVRTDTGLARNAVSISYAAVELAKKIFQDLEGRQAMLLGAGEMSELAAKHLIKHGVDTVVVANRSRDRAASLAAKFDGRVIDWSAALDQLASADIVLASTAAPHPVVTVESVRRAMPRRRYRPIFFIDIAVPRDVDPGVNDVDNAYLYDIDDLQAVVDENRKARAREAEIAEGIVREEVEAFDSQVRSWRVTPTIVALRETAREIVESEMEHHRSGLSELSEEQRETVDSLTRRIVRKLLHRPIRVLKEDARDGNGFASMRMVRRIYELEARTEARDTDGPAREEGAGDAAGSTGGEPSAAEGRPDDEGRGGPVPDTPDTEGAATADRSGGGA